MDTATVEDQNTLASDEETEDPEAREDWAGWQWERHERLLDLVAEYVLWAAEGIVGCTFYDLESNEQHAVENMLIYDVHWRKVVNTILKQRGSEYGYSLLPSDPRFEPD